MQEILGMHMQGCDSQTAVSILGQAVLKSARIIEYASDFPFAVGVHISCVPNQEVTRTGMAYAFTALPDTKNSYPITIYENDVTTAESMAWRAQYPEYNNSNLETQGVLNVQGEGFVFVSKSHPVIDLLRANKDVLNADIDTQPLIDDQWLKVTKQVMSTCCSQIKTKVLNKVGTCDLSNVSVQISRLDGPWKQMLENDTLFKSIPEHLTVSADQPQEEAEILLWEKEQKRKREEFTATYHAILNKQRSFCVRFELEFDLIPQVLP